MAEEITVVSSKNEAPPLPLMEEPASNLKAVLLSDVAEDYPPTESPPSLVSTHVESDQETLLSALETAGTKQQKEAVADSTHTTISEATG